MEMSGIHKEKSEDNLEESFLSFQITRLSGSCQPSFIFFFLRQFQGFCFLFLLCLVFETGFLCSLDCPGTSSVDQAGLRLKDPPASSS